jgi:hypothetical protein
MNIGPTAFVRILFSFIFVLCLNEGLFSQKITISGRIIDDDTEEPIPFCSVFLNGKTPVGVTSDFDGYFTLPIDLSLTNADSIGAISIGYKTSKKVLQRSGADITINFRLKSESITLNEIVVLAGENPANEIIRQINRNKKRNEKKNFDSYAYEMYAKTELDLTNIDPSMKDMKIFKDLQFVFDNIDSVSDVKPFLPAYVAEKIAEVYGKKGAEEKEILKAQKVSGVNNTSIVDFINKMHDKYSVYDNYITLLGKEFVSPFSNTGLMTYEYYILDSTFIEGEWSYKLKFKPRRAQENTFFGDFWVSMENFGVQIVNMRMSPDVNINLVNRIIIYIEFQKKDSLWLPLKDKTVIDFATDKKENKLGIVGRKTQTYKDFEVDDPKIADTYVQLDPEEINWTEMNKDSSFWEENRHEKLSVNESKVYKMVDSIKQVPVFKTVTDILNTIVTGFHIIGPLEIGPYWDLVNYNNVEGWRFGLGLGTSSKLSKKFKLFGYAAYGIHDKKFKYRGSFRYIFDNYRRKEMGIQVRDDVVFESRSTEEFTSQGLFAGFIRRSAIPPKILRVFETKAYYHHTWKKGWSNRLAVLYRQLTPFSDENTITKQGFNYFYIPDISNPSLTDNSITTAEVLFKIRYAYKETVIRGNFNDMSMGSVYPIIELSYIAGIKGILNSEYNYHKLLLKLNHWFNVASFGYLEYTIEAGKVFGKVPFLLLEPHPGNDAYFYNKNAYNMMNSFEFVSDTWVGLRLEHHFDGFFLNRIPLLKKLKWRELMFFRGVWGVLSDENISNNYKNLQVNGGAFYGRFDKGPYMEAGFGIENIFKIIRVDCVWRLSYWDNPYAQKFSVRFTFDFSF